MNKANAQFYQSLFGSSKPLLQETDPMKKFLIVGLGNIGTEYDETRHNIGFKILDSLAEQEALLLKVPNWVPLALLNTKEEVLYA